MELFKDARVVRLCSHHGMYLIAEEDKISVSQDQNGSADCAKWTVEQIGNNNIRLKSCYGTYLTASTERFLLGAIGKKVIQSLSSDSSVQWKPIRDKEGLRLQTNSGNFLRADGGIQPWKNSVTHKEPLRSSSLDYMWHVRILEEIQQPTLEPHDGAGPSAEPPEGANTYTTNHPAITTGHQGKPATGISAKDAMGYVATAAGAVTAASAVAGTTYQITNHVGSTHQQISQPNSTGTFPQKNRIDVTDASSTDRYAGAASVGDAAYDGDGASVGDAGYDGDGTPLDNFSF